jgi:hypothetical protein
LKGADNGKISAIAYLLYKHLSMPMSIHLTLSSDYALPTVLGEG